MRFCKRIRASRAYIQSSRYIRGFKNLKRIEVMVQPRAAFLPLTHFAAAFPESKKIVVAVSLCIYAVWLAI